MGAAVRVVGVVGEALLDPPLAGVVLHRHLDGDALDLLADVDGLVLGLLAGVQVDDVLGDAALGVELVGLAVLLVGEEDGQPAVDVGDLPEPGGEGVVVERQVAEHLGVRLERDGGPGLAGRGEAEVL